MDPENKNKYDFLLKLLSEGDAMVCLDARHPDVSVPKQHKGNAMLNLVFNLNFRRPLEVQEDGIYATLGFGGRPHKCVIPFEAVWAIYVPSTQSGQVWEHSIPQDLDPPATPESESPAAAADAPSAVGQSANGPFPEGAATVKRKRDRSHLRIIK